MSQSQTEDAKESLSPPSGAPEANDATDAMSNEQSTEATAAESSSDASATSAPPAGGDADASSHEQVGDDDGAIAGSEGDEAAASSDTQDDAPKKKKRRRRRKKKSSAGDVAAAPADASESDKKEAPFLRFLEGSAQRHAFAVGEVVAGRVERVADGAIVVDLFGKASATVDLLEPRTVQSESEPAATPGEAASASTSGVGDAAGVSDDAGTSAGVDESAQEAEVSAAPSQDDAASMEAPAATSATAAEPGVSDSAAPEQPAAPEHGAAATSVAPDAEAQPVAEVKADLHGDEDEEAASDAGAGESVAPPAPAAPIDPALLAAVAELEAFEASEPPEAPEVGAIFRGRVRSVSESGHIAIVNRDIDRAAAKAAIEKARAERHRVKGVVFGFNRGGFDVLVHGIRVFCPARGMSLTPIDDPNEWVGKKLEFSLPAAKSGKSIVVTRRSILEREARKAARDRLKELEPGQQLQARVTQVREYGVLVDIGDGVEGLVHQSEVSWRRGVRPADIVKPGDEVAVQVLKSQPATRKDRFGKLSLSMRLCQPDPWEEAEVLQLGVPRDGKVVSVTEFGAFVELAPGVEGLVHISELGGRDIKHASEAVKVGETLHVLVERVDKGQRRITLSKLSDADMAAVADGSFDVSKAPRSLKPGTHVMVVIERVEHHGMQVQVQGVLGRKGRGYISNRDIGTVEDRKNELVVGAVLEAKITGTDRDGGLRCSIKGKQLDDERKAVKEYRREAARQGFGTFGDLLKAKLGQSGEHGD